MSSKNQMVEATVSEMVDRAVADFKNDPRNKVFVEWNLLLASATEERGEHVDGNGLREALARFLGGDYSGDDQDLYDAAVAACGEVARGCFGNSPDEEVDYTVTLLENEEGFVAEVRQSG